MSKPSKPLNIRLGELRPVVDAVELTKGLRGKLVGGRKCSAHLVPADGGMMVELFGSNTFVPVATGALSHGLRVDADLFAGFLRNSTRAFHPAEIVSLGFGADKLVARCGTLRVTLQLGALPSSQRRDSPSMADRTTADVRPTEAESESARAKDIERSPEPPKSSPPEGKGNQNSASATDPTEADLRLWDAESELDRIEEIERKLQSAKRQRPDYKGLRFLAVGWFLLIALSELVFGGDTLAWVVVISSIAFFAQARADFASENEWKKERWKEERKISEILKRIELLGLSARQEPSRWVLKAKAKKREPDA